MSFGCMPFKGYVVGYLLEFLEGFLTLFFYQNWPESDLLDSLPTPFLVESDRLQMITYFVDLLDYEHKKN